ncbi:MAG: hypothetical protein AAF387_15195 [Pseudomonadota bacterium]
MSTFLSTPIENSNEQDDRRLIQKVVDLEIEIDTAEGIVSPNIIRAIYKSDDCSTKESIRKYCELNDISEEEARETTWMIVMPND